MAKRILLVDDSRISIEQLVYILEEQKYEIAGFAEDGNIALEKYKELKLDLVFMDITMPNCDGLKAIEMIKDFDPDAKIVVCSALTQSRTVLDSLKKGALNYILKPFEPEKIIDILNDIFSTDS
jgi:two-component system, chemotaxis family, chemotaxis protein CheY